MEDEKEPLDSPEDEEFAETEDVGLRVSRHVMPLGPRVLARLLPGETRTSTGLYLPAGAKEAKAEVAYAEVIEVARATAEDEDEGFGANVSGVPEGSRILFVKENGLAVPWDDKLCIVAVKDVIATVEELELDEAH